MGIGFGGRLIAAVAAALLVASTGTVAAGTPPDEVPYPDQPVGVPFPTDEWAIGELPAEVDRHALDLAVERAFGAPDAERRVRSLLIVHRGAIVYERYHPLDGPDTVMDSFSIAKSVVSALIGTLVADGALDLDAPAPVAAWQTPGDPRAAITLRQLMQMSGGLPDSNAGLLAAPDGAEYAAGLDLVHEPGTTFEYSDATAALLAGIAAETLGGCDAAIAALHERILDPIGITSDELLLDQAGCWRGFIGANMTARDFARFGLLYLRGGSWDGEEILPSSWIDQSWAPSPTNPDYGLQWWRYQDDVFFAVGLGGQYLDVVPDADMVIVLTGTVGSATGELIDAANFIMSAAAGGWTYT